MLAMASARSALRRIPACRRHVSVFVKPSKTSLNSVLQVSEEVQEALHGRVKKPVVALETAIYTHGFPYPDNIALSSRLESIVRTQGGVPATIGLIDGVARVGMDPEELIRLSQAAGRPETLKISRRDLAYACGARLLGPDRGNFYGGTTIAGTMVLAHLAGIKVFATGGLGGVHRGGENTLDISADLTELGRTPVTVISSGCKSFLDIPRTLEYLETQGAVVGTFADGREGPVDFPGFWSRDSGSSSPQVVQDEQHAAAMIYAQHSMGLSSGMLLANPIPSEAEIPLSEISTIIKDAVEEADRLGISGAKNTPFVLSKIRELTDGKSVKANEVLISSNVNRATLVAKTLLELESQSSSGNEDPADESILNTTVSKLGSAETPRERAMYEHFSNKSLREIFEGTLPKHLTKKHATNKLDIVVAGSVAIDTACDYVPADENTFSNPRKGTSNPAMIHQRIGGVGHNIALAAHYYGQEVRLVSCVGDDLMGRVALGMMQEKGLPTDGVSINKTVRTPQYVAVNNFQKDLVVGMSDMSAIQAIKAIDILDHRLRSEPPSWLVVDANWNTRTLVEWLVLARSHPTASISTALEPVSGAKGWRIFLALARTRKIHTFPRPLVDLATPNALELEAMWKKAHELMLFQTSEHWNIINSFNLPQGSGSSILQQATSGELITAGVPQQAIQLLPFIPTLAVTLGEKGVMLAQILRADDERLSDADAALYIIARSGNIASKDDSHEARQQVGGVYLRVFPPQMVVGGEAVKSVNGAGDTFMGVLVSALANGERIEDAITIGQEAASLSLKSDEAVSEEVKSLAGKSRLPRRWSRWVQ